MSNHTDSFVAEQGDLFETASVRSLLDQLLAESRLYRHGKDYKDLLDFVVRLRNFAPFNAMLLQLQKPGLSYAASAKDWHDRFGRWPKEAARPLLILWRFGPVALVYDVMDTEGDVLPEDVSTFVAHGPFDRKWFVSFESLLEEKQIELCWVDAGDKRAGLIRRLSLGEISKGKIRYRIHINRNHDVTVQFVTLAHELGHLFLGHLGPDEQLNIRQRSRLDHQQQELEAESVAYIVCRRQGVQSKSQPYLSNFVDGNTTLDQIEVYQVMRAAGRVEAILGLADHTKFNAPPRARRRKMRRPR